MSKEVSNDELARMIAEGFTSMGGRIDKVETRMDSLETKVDDGFSDVNTRITMLSNKVDNLNDSLASRVHRLEKHLGLEEWRDYRAEMAAR